MRWTLNICLTLLKDHHGDVSLLQYRHLLARCQSNTGLNKKNKTVRVVFLYLNVYLCHFIYFLFSVKITTIYIYIGFFWTFPYDQNKYKWLSLWCLCPADVTRVDETLLPLFVWTPVSTHKRGGLISALIISRSQSRSSSITPVLLRNTRGTGHLPLAWRW